MGPNMMHLTYEKAYDVHMPPKVFPKATILPISSEVMKMKLLTTEILSDFPNLMEDEHYNHLLFECLPPKYDPSPIHHRDFACNVSTSI